MKHYCYITNKEIPEDRIEALKFLGVPQHLWTTVEASDIKPRKGMFLGESGTSEMIFVSEVGPTGIQRV